jgi:hypothetical protein
MCGNGNVSAQPAELLPRVAVHFLVVHVGKSQPPSYIFDTIRHTRWFNPSRTVVVVTDQPIIITADIGVSLSPLSFVKTPDDFMSWRSALSSSEPPQPGVVNVLIDAVSCSPVHMALKSVERFRDDGTEFWDGFW